MTSPADLPPSTSQSRIGAFFGDLQNKASDLREAVGKSWAIKVTRQSIGNAKARMSTLAMNTGLTGLPGSIKQSVTVKLTTAKNVVTGKVPNIKNVTLGTTDEKGDQKIYSLSNKTLNLVLDRPQQPKGEKVKAKADEAAIKAISKARRNAAVALISAKLVRDPNKKAVRLLAANAALAKQSLATGFANQEGALNEAGVRNQLPGDPASVLEDLRKQSAGRSETTAPIETNFGIVPHQIVRDFDKGLGNSTVVINGKEITKKEDRNTTQIGNSMLEMIAPSKKRSNEPATQNEKDTVCCALATFTQSAQTTPLSMLQTKAMEQAITISEDREVVREMRAWVENNELHTEFSISYKCLKMTENERGDIEPQEMDGITVTQHSSIPIDNPSAARHFPDTFTVYKRT